LLLSFPPKVQEEAELSKIMMGKKTKRLYGRMQHGIQKKKEFVESLERKRKVAETKVEGKKKAHKSTRL